MSITIRENGIYETQDGRIVGPMIKTREYGKYIWKDDNLCWNKHGRISALLNTGADIIREIVVGEGWKPADGDEDAPCVDCDVIFRDGSTRRLEPWQADSYGFAWVENKETDILAYRPIVAEKGDFAIDQKYVGLSFSETEWRRLNTKIVFEPDLPSYHRLSPEEYRELTRKADLYDKLRERVRGFLED